MVQNAMRGADGWRSSIRATRPSSIFVGANKFLRPASIIGPSGIQEGDRRATAGLSRFDACTGDSRNEEGSDCVEVFVGDSIRVRMPVGEPAAVAALVHQLQKTQRAGEATASRFQRIELPS